MRFSLPFVFLFALYSCEKSISFTPDSAEPLVVIEATIENDQAPVVILSRSVNYFSTISPDILANSFIRNATVQISNGTLTHRLREYSIPGANGYTLYYYSIDSLNLSTAFVGEFSKTYTLQVMVDSKEYTAVTTIPALTKDRFTLVEKATGNVDSHLVRLMARVTDPPGLGNYVRYFTRVNDGRFLPGRNSAFDDQIVDGTTYTVQIDKGIDRNEEIEDEETFALFSKGDTVTMKQANIDKATYDFWRTMEYSYASIGNPFSSPTKVLTNIKGGGLGYFGGYAAQYVTLIIPK